MRAQLITARFFKQKESSWLLNWTNVAWLKEKHIGSGALALLNIDVGSFINFWTNLAYLAVKDTEKWTKDIK